MVDTLIGIATYGLCEFTKLAIQGIRETVKTPYQIYCVVGKSDDVESTEYFDSENIPYSYHEWNKGFPVAINDIYNFGWKNNNFDNIIIQGNDVIPYPYAIDSMIEVPKTTDYEWICANQYDVKSLCRDYPNTKKYFSTESYIFDFSGEPWKLVQNFSPEIIISGPGMSDVQNLCLYTKSVFDKIGYTDPSFYPAYYIDNDYARRGVNANIKSCTLPNSVYFHFWSRVIHQGSGGSTHRAFENNRRYYKMKWNGDFGQEKFRVPFNGFDFQLAPDIILKGSLKIDNRENEEKIARYWSSKL